MEGQRMRGRRALHAALKSLSTGVGGNLVISKQGHDFTVSLY